MRPAPVVLLALLLSLPGRLDAALHVWGTERAVATPVPASAGGEPQAVAAAAGSGEALIAWTNRDAAYETRFASGSTAGVTSRLPVSGTPSVAGAGGGFLRVWNEGSLLRASRFEGGAAYDLGSLADGESVAALAGTESAALVVVADWNREVMRARLLGPDGSPDSDWLSLGPAALSYGIGAVALVADGSGFVLLNIDEFRTSPITQGVRGRRITAGGVSNEFRIETSPRPVTSIAAAFDGERYVVLLQNSWYADGPRGSRAVLVSIEGIVDSEPIEVGPEGTDVAGVVGRPGGSLVLLTDFELGPIVAVPLDHVAHSAGTPVEVAPFEPSAMTRLDARVLISWSGWDRNGAGVLGRWLDATTGVPLSEPFLISEGTPDQSHPAVALGNAFDLVVWEELDPVSRSGSVRAARIRPDGTVVDTTPLRISANGVDAVTPAVAFDGIHFVVVWSEPGPDGMGGRLLARRVRQDGLFADAAPIVISAERSATPALAHAGGTTLVTWAGYGTRRTPLGSAREIFGARLGVDGSLIDPVPLLISRDPWDHYDPDVVAGRDVFLVGWQTYLWYGGHSPVRTASSVAVVTPGGTVYEPVPLQPLELSVNAGAPQVAWNGSEFLAAWRARGTMMATTVTESGTAGTSRQLNLSRLADATFLEGSWHIVSGATSYPHGGAGASIDGVFLSDLLRLELVLPPIEAGDAVVTEPAVASNGRRAVIVWRRIDHASPWNGSGRIMLRVYDAAADCCAPPPKHRAARH